MAMLMKRLLNFTPKPTSFYSSSSSLLHFSSKSTSDSLIGVADVIAGDDGLVCGVPRVEFPTLNQPRVVVYDGVCHLSHQGVKWLIKVDKYEKIKFCCLQSNAAQPYLRMCGFQSKNIASAPPFLFIEALGLYHYGSSAALRVVSYLPLPYSALTTLAVVPAPLRDAVYNYIAERRYRWFGKSKHCLVLKDQHLLHRFIDRDEILRKSGSNLY